MVSRNFDLPQDVEKLQEMVADLSVEKKNYETEINLLKYQINQLKQELFGRKSEKLSSLPDDSFKAASLFPIEDASVEEKEEKLEVVEVSGFKRKKKGRKRLSQELQRVEIVHDLPEEAKTCACGCQLKPMGQEESEQLEMIPAHLWVVKNIRLKYVCKNCENLDSNDQTIKIAPVPTQLLPKSFSTPSLLAHIFVSKYCDSLPFYRQEQQFRRYGISLPRATMCNWNMKVMKKLKPLLELIYRHILSGGLINCDETPFQVLKEPGRKVETASYMWVLLGGPPGQPAYLFNYSQRRSGSVAAKLLGDYKGVVQTDGYSGYDFLDKQPNVVHVSCWAHVRRKFYTIVKQSKKSGVSLVDFGNAGHVVNVIKELYDIESKAREQNLSPEEICDVRRDQSKTIVNDLKKFLDKLSTEVPPTSPLGRAVFYSLNQWPRLIKYLDHGIMTMDNNMAENAIRPFVVGRKNWLFFEQPDGAEAGALLYSIIETAKANNLNPYDYLLYIFDQLPLIQDCWKLETLLPWNLNNDDLKNFKIQYLERKGHFN